MKNLLTIGAILIGASLTNFMLAPPAARLTDFHQEPLSTPSPIAIPHVGGPIVGPGAPTVLIGKLPVAKIGQMLVTIQPAKVADLGPLQARSAVDILTNNQIGSVITNKALARPIVPSGGLIIHPHPLIHPGAMPTPAIIGRRLSDNSFRGQQIINIHQTPFGPKAMPGLLQHP